MPNIINFAEEPMLDFTKLLKVLQRRNGMVRITVLFFLLGALLYALLWPRTYKSLTTVKVPDSSQITANTRDLAFFPVGGDPIETYLQVAGADRVALEVIHTLHLQSEPQFKNLSEIQLVHALQKSAIKFDNVKHSNIISIEARAKSAQMAADLANAWAQGFIHLDQELNQEGQQNRYRFLHGQLSLIRQKLAQDAHNKQNYFNPSEEAEADQMFYRSLLEQDEENRIRADNGDTGIVVVDPASVPDDPVWPKSPLCVLLGLLGGLFVGVLVAFVQEIREDRVHDGEDLSRTVQAPFWASIPHLQASSFPLPAAAIHSWPPTHPWNAVCPPAFKLLRAKLLSSHPEEGHRAVSVLSPGHGEGRTLANAYLAISLAQAGKKVLLVDADWENPSLEKLFGMEGDDGRGLAALLSDPGSFAGAIRRSSVPNLDLVASAAGFAALSEILSPVLFKKWLEKTKADYDYLLLDMAPLLDSPDALLLCTVLDGALLLAHEGHTRCRQVQKSLELLQEARVPVWGSLLNSTGVKTSSWWDLKMAAPLPIKRFQRNTQPKVVDLQLS